MTQSNRFNQFIIPLIVALTLLCAGILAMIAPENNFSELVLLFGIAIGSWQLLSDTYKSLRNLSFALDYIAILAITTGLLTHNYLVAGVIVLMMSGGNALEAFAQAQAKKSLTALKNRIPNHVTVVKANHQTSLEPIEKISIGSEIIVRKGEVVPLDGTLQSATGNFDESSLTGEPFPITKQLGEMVHSGTVNTGDVVTIKTSVVIADSTYHRIITLVKEAESARSPFIQLADKLSGGFTLLTILLAGIAYFISGDISRVLAVLVIATPCPLILATPIALIGGMSAAAQQRIIFKRLASLEILARAKQVVFDKTGTITIGQPTLESITLINKNLTEKTVLGLAAGLEKNSLHPYAKAIVAAAESKKIIVQQFTQISEKIGSGIQGMLKQDTFLLSGNAKYSDSQVVLSKNDQPIAVFSFKDELKPTSIEGISAIQKMDLTLSIYTGDTISRAQELLKKLPHNLQLQADLSPEQKLAGIRKLQADGDVVAMVGDGINDAPALAAADVGLVFSHQEQTAASETADVVLLNGHFDGVLKALQISHHTMMIAKQSMYVGVGLSLIGMLFALGGYLPPVAGALTQEVIDVAVILNALRAAKYHFS
jgi:heavy metal translocating P-type ATPase